MEECKNKNCTTTCITGMAPKLCAECYSSYITVAEVWHLTPKLRYMETVLQQLSTSNLGNIKWVDVETVIE